MKVHASGRNKISLNFVKKKKALNLCRTSENIMKITKNVQNLNNTRISLVHLILFEKKCLPNLVPSVWSTVGPVPTLAVAPLFLIHLKLPGMSLKPHLSFSKVHLPEYIEFVSNVMDTKNCFPWALIKLGFYKVVWVGSVLSEIFLNFNPLSVKTTKWSNTLKQFLSNLPTNCLSVFHYVV